MPAVESKLVGLCKNMGMGVLEEHELGAFDGSIVLFCVLVGLMRMRLFLLMAEQTRIAAIEQNRMSDSGSER